MDRDIRRLQAAAAAATAPGDRVVVVGRRTVDFGELVGSQGKVLTVADGHDALDDVLLDAPRTAVISIDVDEFSDAVVNGARATLDRWRPFVFVAAQACYPTSGGTNLSELHRALRRSAYVVRRLYLFGLRRADTGLTAEPGYWVAVPCERKEMLSEIAARIMWAGLLPRAA